MNVRRTRLVTGSILFTYLTTHLLNHALGLISLDAMEAGRIWFLALWRNPVGTTAFYGSLLVHFGLALWAIYQRHHLRMPLGEALQLALGLCIPPLLTVHFVGTRMAYEWYGVEDSYAKIGVDAVVLDPCLRRAAGAADRDRMDAWLHRALFLAATAPLVRALCRAVFRVRFTYARLGATGLCPGGRASRILDRARSGLDRTASSKRRTRSPSARAKPWSGCTTALSTAFGLVWDSFARAHGPPDKRSAQQASDHLSRRPRGACAARFFDLGSEPVRGYSPCFGVRRPRPLLDLPRSRLPLDCRRCRRRALPSSACSIESARRRA